MLQKIIIVNSNIFFMSSMYLNLYNNFISLTTNKMLYKGLKNQDIFADRLKIFLIHFAFFLKIYKSKDNKKILQEIYDFNFRQLELSIREIGYGDQSINKKMKVYINIFHSMVSDVHYWHKLDKSEKNKKLSSILENFGQTDELVDYFDKYSENLSKISLNSYLKSVNNS